MHVGGKQVCCNNQNNNNILGHVAVLSSTKMVLYELKMKVDWYLICCCLKSLSMCLLCVTCDDIILLYAQYLRNNVQRAHVCRGGE